jgi:hypothetical protein
MAGPITLVSQDMGTRFAIFAHRAKIDRHHPGRPLRLAARFTPYFPTAPPRLRPRPVAGHQGLRPMRSTERFHLVRRKHDQRRREPSSPA